MVEIYDSKQKKVITEPQFAGSVLGFLYNTIIGRLLLKAIFLHPFFWRMAAVLQKRPSTKVRVRKYIEKYHIVPGDYVDSNWRSFYDFFNRQLKPGVVLLSGSVDEVISVAEAKLLAVPVTGDLVVTIKHRTYDLASIVGSADLLLGYEGGTALIYRLSMHNYHRYIFPTQGAISFSKKHKGVLHTVSSISNSYPVYSINQREVTVLNTAHFGEMIMIEIGAMMAGKIINYEVSEFEAGQEKGRFEIGGSTILVLYKKATIELNDTINKYSKNGIEVTVGAGEVIGKYV